MSTRLWGGSLGAAAALHGGAALAALLWLQTPVHEMPAGAFAVELASFGGAAGASGGGAPAAAPPEARIEPRPEPEAVKPPPVVEPEVALPKPTPKPKPKPVPPKPAAKPAPEPPPKAAAAPRPPPAAEAPPAAAREAAIGGAGGAGEGSAGSPISGRLGGGGVDAGTPLGRYKALVYRTMWTNRRYPAVAQRMGYEGEVEVAFTVAADGDIRHVRILRESGFGALDREAEALFGRVRRFPPFPPELSADSLTFRIVIPFRLS